MIGFPYGFTVTYQAAPDADPPALSPHSDHYCPRPGCDTSWWGPEPCWVCGTEGVARAALPEPDRKVWMWTNQFRPSFEGDPPA